MAPSRTKLIVLPFLLLVLLVIRPSLGNATEPTPFNQFFCGGWMSSPFEAAGASNIVVLSSMSTPNSTGNAYSNSCGGTKDGTYTWSVRHGTVNTVTQHGTEHGTFNEAITSPGTATLGGIFDGQIFKYNAAALLACTPSASSTGTTIIYESAGHFDTLKNNSNLTGAISSFHWHGEYVATVTQDKYNNCHFEADLTGQKN